MPPRQAALAAALLGTYFTGGRCTQHQPPVPPSASVFVPLQQHLGYVKRLGGYQPRGLLRNQELDLHGSVDFGYYYADVRIVRARSLATPGCATSATALCSGNRTELPRERANVHTGADS